MKTLWQFYKDALLFREDIFSGLLIWAFMLYAAFMLLVMVAHIVVPDNPPYDHTQRPCYRQLNKRK